jgi:SpoVK/Ycf46/Vps4 family AAA+-type ATPase
MVGVDVDRYRHDLNQAIAMRGGSTPIYSAMSKRELSPSSTQVLTRDVDLAFKGLEDAEALQVAGKLEHSLKLYELSLELLIRVLKSIRTQNNHGSSSAALDPVPIEARVHLALAAAEKVKAQLGSARRSGVVSSPSFESGRGSRNEQSASEPSSEGSKSFWSLSNALASTLRQETTKHATEQKPSLASDRGSPQYVSAGVSDEASKMILSEVLIDADTLLRTTWDDIQGLEKVKLALQEAAILPLMRPDLFSGLRKPQNILLWGPPGTGKTMLVRAVAQESGSSLFCVTAATATSKWMGEAEKLVRALFSVAHQLAPSLIYIDEVDSLLSARKSEGEHEASRRLKTEFMVQMDGISKVAVVGASNQVLVLACTNCPWDLDSAVLRRFPRRIYVPLPDEAGRRGLLSTLLKKAGRHSLTPSQVNSLAIRLDGYSCSDIAAIASEASFGPLRSLGGLEEIRKVKAKDVRPITMSDFDAAMSQASRSVTVEHLERYEEWKRSVAT